MAQQFLTGIRALGVTAELDPIAQRTDDRLAFGQGSQIDEPDAILVMEQLGLEKPGCSLDGETGFSIPARSQKCQQTTGRLFQELGDLFQFPFSTNKWGGMSREVMD